mgnify:FL=1
MYILTSGMNPNEDHICHYGRKGMRWGQHIFGMAMMGPYYSVYRKEMDNQAKKRGYNNYDEWAKSEKKQRQQNKLKKQFKTVENHRLNRNKSEKSDSIYSQHQTKGHGVASKIEHDYITKSAKLDDKKLKKYNKLEQGILNENIKAGRDFIVKSEVKRGLLTDKYKDTIIANPNSKRMKQYADILNDSAYNSNEYQVHKGKDFVKNLDRKLAQIDGRAEREWYENHKYLYNK